MISNSSSEAGNNQTLNAFNLVQETDQTSCNTNTSNILSNPTSDYNQKNIHSKSELNSSHFPLNNSVKSNNSSEEPKEEEGVFTRFFNYLKDNLNPWKIEEEECIDAHGFKCKRPKTKIPLREKHDSYGDEVMKAGGTSVSYASQNSGFGRLFL